MPIKRNPQIDKPRNIALTATEALYERLHQRGMTHDQIADATGRGAQTVRNALSRVRAKRRDMENLAKVRGGLSV